MDSPIVKGILIGLAIFLTFYVGQWGVKSYLKTQPLQKQADSKSDLITTSLNNAEFDNYNNKDVTGAEVLSVINTKASQQLTIQVKTLAHIAGVNYTAATYNITDRTEIDYIEPSGTFTGTINRTSNNTVTSITFTQK